MHEDPDPDFQKFLCHGHDLNFRWSVRSGKFLCHGHDLNFRWSVRSGTLPTSNDKVKAWMSCCVCCSLGLESFFKRFLHFIVDTFHGFPYYPCCTPHIPFMKVIWAQLRKALNVGDPEFSGSSQLLSGICQDSGTTGGLRSFLRTVLQTCANDLKHRRQNN